MSIIHLVIKTQDTIKILGFQNGGTDVIVELCDMELSVLLNSVEKAIHDLGVDPAQARGEEQGQWLLMRNETPIYLDAWTAEQKSPWNYFIFEEDATTFQLTIPFCYAPTLQREAFLEELLTVNLNILYGKFTYNAKDNVVALIFRVPGKSFQPSDLTHIIDGLMYYSEMAYHVLKDEFTLKRVLVEEN
ncbi:MAG: YbjN domain-containing protein [Sphingomonadales bacterium]|nr:YbjN domain-containing protein [Sphingomonadales bacterium]